MSDARDNVLDKLDALLKKHAVNEPEIPVLTDLVEGPQLDLDAIPVLTEEISTRTSESAAEMELDLVPDPEPPTWAPTATPSPSPPQAPNVSTQVPPVAPKPSTQTRLPSGDSAQFQIEIPVDATYVTVTAPLKTAAPSATAQPPLAAARKPTITAPPAPAAHLDEVSLQRIAALVEADLSHHLQQSLRQALSKELQGMLHVSLDKVLSSLLDQHMMMIEETVRTTVADEIQKQLAQLRTHSSTENK